MKKTTTSQAAKKTVLLLVLMLSTATFGQKSLEKEEDKIQWLIVKSFDEVWGDLNPANINKYYTPDFLLLENGEIWNNDTIKKLFKQSCAQKSTTNSNEHN